MKRRDPPLPPTGKPPPLSVSVARQRLLLLLLLLLPPPAPPHAARSSHDHPSRPRRWVREPPPPGAAAERGGFAGPRCPHPGRQSHGAEARGPAPPIPPPPRFSPFICFISFFFFLFFFLFLLFLPPSPFLSFPLASEGGGRRRDYFFPRRRDLGARPSGGDAARSRNRIRRWRRDPRRAEGGEAAGRPRCSLTLLLSAALRRLRRGGRSLRPHGQLAAAQAGHAALRAAAGGDGTGHDGGGFPAPPQPGCRALAAVAAFCCCFPRRPSHAGLVRPAEVSRRAPLPVTADQSLCPRRSLRCAPGSRRCALCVRQSRAAARARRRPTLRSSRKRRL